MKKKASVNVKKTFAFFGINEQRQGLLKTRNVQPLS